MLGHGLSAPATATAQRENINGTFYQFQTPKPVEAVDAAALQRFVTDIWQLMALRREAGKEDFAGRTYVVLLFPDAIGNPAISGASELTRGERFALYALGPH